MLGFVGDGDQVLVHLLGTVVVPGGLLHRSATAEVEMAAGHRRGATRPGGLLQDQDLCPCRRRAHRGTAAGDTEAHHHHVRFIGPLGNVGGVEGLGHSFHHFSCCSCLT